MNNRMEWREAVMDLPVFDTHTHLNMPGVPVEARDVWDIVHYFWFHQELMAVGYPSKPMELPEAERVERFVKAFHRVRNTVWAKMVRETFRNLYGIRVLHHGDKPLLTVATPVNVVLIRNSFPRANPLVFWDTGTECAHPPTHLDIRGCMVDGSPGVPSVENGIHGKKIFVPSRVNAGVFSDRQRGTDRCNF